MTLENLLHVLPTAIARIIIFTPTEELLGTALLAKLLHRDNNLPAVIGANEDREWWSHGKRHRGNGQPAVVYADGRQEYYNMGARIL